LPRLKESLATQQVDVEVGDLPAGSGTILVAENDDTVRVVVRRILELRGYRVLEARHGGEAIDILRREADAIQLVVTDIMMPVMDGLALSKRVHQDYPGKKLLFVSGYADLAREGDAEAIGGTNFLQKPFTSDALVRKVHTVLTK
jgi:two-component system cell cycle sensor histidine kinase/response regulator CckA